MLLGVKRSMVELLDHNTQWEEKADELINSLKELLINYVIDIQHIGSTAIKSIKAKPIIDILVGIINFDNIDIIKDKLEQNKIIHRPNNDREDYRFFVIDREKEIRTHHIHIVKHNNEEWNNIINFRDYLINNFEEAKSYEKLKIELYKENKNNRRAYLMGKEEYILEIFKKAKEWRENKT